MTQFLYHPLVLIIIGTISVARTARLITHDTFPPIEWARPRIAAKLGKWQDLVVCPFCIAPYLMAGQIIWFSALYHTSAFDYWWLLPNLWWTASYASAIIVAYDQPEE